MSATVKSQIEILINLQENQNQGVALRKTLAEVESKEVELDKTLHRERLALKEKTDELDGLRKQYQGFEDDLHYNEQRLEKSEGLVRKVTNNRDYQVLLREIDDNKKMNSRIQETMLALLEELEALEAGVKEMTDRFHTLEEETAAEKESLAASCVREREGLAALDAERDGMVKGAPARLLKLFDHAVENGGGFGIAPVRENICRGCFMSLPPQFCIELQRFNEIQNCPRCRRIVYWDMD